MLLIPIFYDFLNKTLPKKTILAAKLSAIKQVSVWRDENGDFQVEKNSTLINYTAGKQNLLAVKYSR